MFKIIVLASFTVLFFVLAFISSRNKHKLNNIKADKVGDGQYGTDKFMTIEDAKKIYTEVEFPDKVKDMSNEWLPGRLIFYDVQKNKALIDSSLSHASIQAPTSSGKTTELAVPNLQYNLMAGVNMIVPCIKKEILNLSYQEALDLGYKTYVIDFEDPSKSVGFDFFSDINESLKKFDDTNNLKYRAQAETAAGKLANDIVSSRPRGESENKFFEEASLGLIQSIILLVCMFAEEPQKHFSSVRKVIQGILSMQQDLSVSAQKGKQKDPKISRLLKGMPDDFGPKKHIGAAFAASNETEDNIYASVLGDLRAMNDTMAEQIISVPGKKEMFSFMSLIKEKCILYIVLPDTKKEFFIFFKLIIKKIINQLSDYANEYCNGTLERQVRIPWDEFTLSPKMDDIGDDLAIDRSKNILIDLYYQDSAQLIEKYGENIMKIIEHNCATNYILGVAAKDTEEAKRISESLGTVTIKSGSVSYSRDNTIGAKINSSITEQMIERPLMTQGEVLRMTKNKNRLILRQGESPLLVKLTPYYSDDWPFHPTSIKDYLQKESPYTSVDYIDFMKLENRLNQYKEKNGYVFQKSKLEIEIKMPEQEVKKQLAKLSNDDYRINELVDQKRWLQLYNVMSEYKVPRIEVRKIIGILKEE